MYGFDNGGAMFGSGLTMLLWWLLPIAFGVWLAYYLCRLPAGKSSALDNPKERYGRGETAKDSFKQRKRNLGG